MTQQGQHPRAFARTDENPAIYAALEDVMAAAGTSPLRAQLPPAQAARWRQEFPGREQALRALRRWLGSVLPPCPVRDDVTSVATELAANAIVHTASGRGGTFAVDVAWRPGLVRVAVTDGGAPGGPRVTDDPDGESGRGLLLVQGLSLRSGGER